jgi:phenylalanyl-tRNA synthetase beta chain
VARIYGYHKLPSIVQPTIYIKQPKDIEKLFSLQSKIKHYLKDLGLHEVMNYSMISREMIDNNDFQDVSHLELNNSISEDIKYMRVHLTPSLIKNIKDNEGKKNILTFFEIAKTYKPKINNLPQEEYKLGIVTNTSFFDLKGIIDALFKELNIVDFEIVTGSHRLLDESCQGKIVIDKQTIGEFGQLKPIYQLRNQIKSSVFLAIFDINILVKFIQDFVGFKSINPYAIIKLDLTLTVNPKKTYQQIRAIAFKTSKLLQNLEVISLYKNKLSLRFYFASRDRNITEDEAKIELEKIHKVL